MKTPHFVPRTRCCRCPAASIPSRPANDELMPMMKNDSRLFTVSLSVTSWIILLMLTSTTLAAAELEHLGQPCRAFNVLAGRVVTDSSDRQWLVLSNMNEQSGAELI